MTDLSERLRSHEEWTTKQLREEAANELDRLASKERHLLDVYEALGIEWGSDPFPVIALTELKLLLEPLETAALMFEEKVEDPGPFFATRDVIDLVIEEKLLKQLCGSIRALSEAMRKS